MTERVLELSCLALSGVTIFVDNYGDIFFTCIIVSILNYFSKHCYSLRF